jgi:hypothetical protein
VVGVETLFGDVVWGLGFEGVGLEVWFWRFGFGGMVLEVWV